MKACVPQPFETADARLSTVLDREELFLRMAKRLGTAAAIREQKRFARLEHVEPQGQLDVSQVLEARNAY